MTRKARKQQPDIIINGEFGFYTIFPESDAGAAWVTANVNAAQWQSQGGAIYCDDTRMAQDIADAAALANLRVLVNGHPYESSREPDTEQASR